MARAPKKPRNFRLEYHRRTIRGAMRGWSRARSRGHATAADSAAEARPVAVDRKDPLELALQLMKKGVSQKSAAKQFRVSVERLRRYQKLNTQSERVGGKWKIVDVREVEVLLASRGKLLTVRVTREKASDISKYWTGVNKFLETNKKAFLQPFEGMGIRDVKGKLHPFETRPNVLRRLDSSGDFTFIDIYRQTAQS